MSFSGRHGSSVKGAANVITTVAAAQSTSNSTHDVFVVFVVDILISGSKRTTSSERVRCVIASERPGCHGYTKRGGGWILRVEGTTRARSYVSDVKRIKDKPKRAARIIRD